MVGVLDVSVVVSTNEGKCHKNPIDQQPQTLPGVIVAERVR